MAQRLQDTDIQKKMATIPGWEQRGNEITRQYRFSDFVAAMAFVNHVATLAEQMDHHPDILIQYNKVRLTLSTHSSGGLTDLDFTLAQRTDV